MQPQYRTQAVVLKEKPLLLGEKKQRVREPELELLGASSRTSTKADEHIMSHFMFPPLNVIGFVFVTILAMTPAGLIASLYEPYTVRRYLNLFTR